MNGKRRFLSIILVMIIVAIAVSGVTFYVLYKVAFEQQRERLIETAQSHARLLEAIARFDTHYSVDDVSGGAFSATLGQIKEAHENFKGFGKTGEFTLAKRERDQIVFLLRHRHNYLEKPITVPFSSGLAEPMRRALLGESGTIVGQDYQGERVLAAYEPVAILNLGIVAKIDLSEVRSPFIKAGMVAGGICGLLIFLGIVSFLRIGNPVFQRLAENERKYRTLFKSAADMLWFIDFEGRVLDYNQVTCSKYGYSNEELLERSIEEFIHPEYRHLFAAAKEKIKEGKSFSTESIHVRKDGISFPVEMRMSPMLHGGQKAILVAAHDITERKRAQEALHKSEEQYRTMTSNIPGITYRAALDKDWTVYVMNEYCEQITGYPATDFIHNAVRTYASIIHHEDTGYVEQEVHKAVESKRPWEIEYRIFHRNGSIRWLYEKGRALHDKDGQVEYLDGVIVDVTGRKLSEEKEKALAARAAAAAKMTENIVEFMADGLFLIDTDGKIVSWNQALEQISGHRKHEVLGTTAAELFKRVLDPDDVDKALKDIGHALQGKSIPPARYVLTTKDGGKVPIMVAGSFMEDMDRKNRIFISTVKDITEQKQAEEALQESEEKWRYLSENAPDIITTVDRDGKVLFVNHTVPAISKEGVIGQSVYDLLPPEDRDNAREAIERVFRREEAISEYEFRGLGPDGSMNSWYSCRVGSVTQGGEIVAATVIATDITERKQTEEKLRRYQEHLEELVDDRTNTLRREISERKHAEERVKKLNQELEERVKDRTEKLEIANKELRRLDEMKDTFLSSVSHELRTPLTSIRSFSEILLQYDDEGPETRKEFMEIIKGESERLTRLINNFLDLSKIESGQEVYHDDLVSLEEIIMNSVNSQHPILRKESLEFNLDVSPDLPFVFADRDKIQQVIVNLLANAIKFSFKGGEIRLTAEAFEGKRSGETTEWIRVSVSDQGIGIDKEDFDIIFDKFGQISTDTLKDKPKGTGLGLPICKEIISHYEGNIGVESRKGKGSTFFFTIPAAPPLHKSTTKALFEAGEAAELKDKTILVLDDHPDVRRFFCYQLQRRGYKVLEASDETELLEHAQKTKIDLITLDLIMPGMNGHDILGIIREEPSLKNIPVLIVSMVEDNERGILLGANGYLKKPFKVDELIQAVQNIFGNEKRSVLVVDDEPGVLEMICLQLEEMGYPVNMARDGEEALDFLEKQTPDIMILDVCMPKKSGYEVLSWIRNQPRTRNLPVIIITGNKLTDEKAKFFSLGLNTAVEKSLGLNFLFEKIDSMLMSSVERAQNTQIFSTVF